MVRVKRSEVVEEIDRRLGALVRTLRKERKLTQTQLADQLGVTYQQVQKYESGQTRLSVALLIKLSDVLDVRVPYFFLGLGLCTCATPRSEEASAPGDDDLRRRDQSEGKGQGHRLRAGSD